MKAKHLPKTDCHIRITAEIKVNLEQICDSAKPGKRQIYLLQRKYNIRGASHGVCNEQLLRKPADKTSDSLRNFFAVHAALGQLALYVTILNDRPCNQLRKKTDVQKYVAEPLAAAPSSLYASMT